jgi:hypothetical protein
MKRNSGLILVERNEFAIQVNNYIANSNCPVAIHLFIVPEWLSELKLDKDVESDVTKEGQNVLQATDMEGIFTRIGWASYFALTGSSKENCLNVLERKLRTTDAKNADLWRFGLMVIRENEPLSVFKDLEWKSLEKARHKGKSDPEKFMEI